MKVAILFDAGSEEWSPQDVAAVVANVHEVRDVLRRRGHEVELLPVRFGDFRWLSRVRRADLVFNLCEGINGHARFEDFIVGTLELVGVPFTGCHTWPVSVCHRKHVANTLLSAAGLPVPAFTLAQANKTPSEFPLPAIVKPAAEDASVGIDNGAVCTSKRALKKRVAQMLEQFDEVLVQEYVAHSTYVMLIEGISRSCSHELVRHRAGFGYSQLSQRYVDESHAAFVMPPAIMGDPVGEAEWTRQVEAAQAAYVASVERLMTRYEWVEDKVHRRKMAREAARSVLPNATEVKIVVSANVRAWRTMLELRLGEGAELEIRRMAVACLRVLQQEAPALFADFEIYSSPEGGEAGRVGFHKV